MPPRVPNSSRSVDTRRIAKIAHLKWKETFPIETDDNDDSFKEFPLSLIVLAIQIYMVCRYAWKKWLSNNIIYMRPDHFVVEFIHFVFVPAIIRVDSFIHIRHPPTHTHETDMGGTSTISHFYVAVVSSSSSSTASFAVDGCRRLGNNFFPSLSLPPSFARAFPLHVTMAC